jgi:hypothetical protein
MTSCAAFIKESRMNFVEPIALNRKSGGVETCPELAEGDLQFTEPASDSNRSPALPFVIPTEPRSSYCAAPSMATRAAFLEESRIKPASATKLDRKSGGAKWRDLQFLSPLP